MAAVAISAAAPLSDFKPSTNRTPSEFQVVEFRQLRTHPEYIVVNAIDRAQNRQAAAREHHDVAPQPPVYQLVQFSGFDQHRASDAGFMTHQIDKLAR